MDRVSLFEKVTVKPRLKGDEDVGCGGCLGGGGGGALSSLIPDVFVERQSGLSRLKPSVLEEES